MRLHGRFRTGCRQRGAFTLATLLLLILVSAPAQARTLSFCFADFVPYETQQDDRASGISVDMYREAARRAGYDAAFTELPWQRCVQDVQTGSEDFAMDGVPRDDLQYIDVSVCGSYYVFVVPEDSPIQTYQGPDQFAGKEVSIVTNWFLPDALAADRRIGWHPVPDQEAQLKSLAMGRQDAALNDLVTLMAYARRFNLPVRPLKPAIGVYKRYLLYAQRKTEEARSIEAALRQMIDDKTVDRIFHDQVNLTAADLSGLLWRPAGTTALDTDQLRVVAKMFNFLEKKPATGAILLVAGAAADLEQAKREFPAFTVVAGPASQSKGAFAVLVDSAAEAREATAAERSIITVTGNLACVDAGACLLSVETRPKVSIYLSRSAAFRGNVNFDPTFRMLMIER
jgi:ABC-type amino acid transport substrate-binding protein